MKKFRSRIVDAWVDPLRRRNVLARIVESVVPAFLVLVFLVGLDAFWLVLFIVLGEFLLYELVLEPWGLSGHYWERGPRDGEVFTRP